MNRNICQVGGGNFIGDSKEEAILPLVWTAPAPDVLKNQRRWVVRPRYRGRRHSFCVPRLPWDTDPTVVPAP
ncbi:hypothetical protein EUGRSUZ_B01780 [Eucalyptus grandis]|uniref:Uncharacterized protein n=2 Tax=Eucalyptus grandis TaxID=71139 RepID=A0ACC3LSX7_EUCGR|nr:hypothetical protein EUGRSUZ_B01780 [Eucalyptus grandis]